MNLLKAVWITTLLAHSQFGISASFDLCRGKSQLLDTLPLPKYFKTSKGANTIDFMSPGLGGRVHPLESSSMPLLGHPKLNLEAKISDGQISFGIKNTSDNANSLYHVEYENVSTFSPSTLESLETGHRVKIRLRVQKFSGIRQMLFGSKSNLYYVTVRARLSTGQLIRARIERATEFLAPYLGATKDEVLSALKMKQEHLEEFLANFGRNPLVNDSEKATKAKLQEWLGIDLDEVPTGLTEISKLDDTVKAEIKTMISDKSICIICQTELLELEDPIVFIQNIADKNHYRFMEKSDLEHLSKSPDGGRIFPGNRKSFKQYYYPIKDYVDSLRPKSVGS